MHFPYHFVSLSEEQNTRRRELLTAYGQFAQLSILLIPLLLQISQGLRLIFRNLLLQSNAPRTKERQSPAPVPRKVFDGLAPSARFGWPKLQWTLGSEVAQGWGSFNQWIFAAAWGIWLLALILKDTGDGSYP